MIEIWEECARFKISKPSKNDNKEKLVYEKYTNKWMEKHVHKTPIQKLRR